MSTTNHIQILLNSTMQAVQQIIPQEVSFDAPSLSKEPYVQQEVGVLVGIVGDINGRLMITTSTETFTAIGSTMFGMPIEGPMLESFIGEFGNMIAGQICTYSSSQQVDLDITTPTVMVGETKIFGFQHAFLIPAKFENYTVSVLVTFDQPED